MLRPIMDRMDRLKLLIRNLLFLYRLALELFLSYITRIHNGVIRGELKLRRD